MDAIELAELMVELRRYRRARERIREQVGMWAATRKWEPGVFKYSDEGCTAYRMALEFCLTELEKADG